MASLLHFGHSTLPQQACSPAFARMTMTPRPPPGVQTVYSRCLTRPLPLKQAGHTGNSSAWDPWTRDCGWDVCCRLQTLLTGDLQHSCCRARALCRRSHTCKTYRPAGPACLETPLQVEDPADKRLASQLLQGQGTVLALLLLGELAAQQRVPEPPPRRGGWPPPAGLSGHCLLEAQRAWEPAPQFHSQHKCCRPVYVRLLMSKVVVAGTLQQVYQGAALQGT